MEASVIYAAMMARTVEATNFWTSALSVKPVQDSITIQYSSIMPAAVVNKVYTDADLVVVMTARRACRRRGPRHTLLRARAA